MAKTTKATPIENYYIALCALLNRQVIIQHAYDKGESSPEGKQLPIGYADGCANKMLLALKDAAYNNAPY